MAVSEGGINAFGFFLAVVGLLCEFASKIGFSTD